MTLSSVPGSNWFSKFFIPKFSRKTMQNIKGEILKGTRTDIVNAIALQMWCHTQYPTPSEYNGALRMLVDKYPVLQDKFGNGIVSTVIYDCLHLQLLIPYPPENKPPSKISPVPSFTLKFLHRYVCLDYKPPSHQVDCIRTRARERVRNPALQLTTSTKRNLLYGSGF